MEFLNETNFKELTRPGVVSLQLLSPHNSRSSRVTITRVTVAPGADQPQHAHNTSEQIWVVTGGTGTLLLADDKKRVITAGDVVRFEDGDLHGFDNNGAEPFVYVAVTSPPINFDDAYDRQE